MWCVLKKYQVSNINWTVLYYKYTFNFHIFDLPVDIVMGIAFISVLMHANSPKTDVIARHTMLTIHHVQLPGIWCRYNVQIIKWIIVAVAAKSRHYKKNNITTSGYIHHYNIETNSTAGKKRHMFLG
jgi:hypothetical protein